MSFELTILGASAALPTVGKMTTCQYLTIQNFHFLIDCGEGAQHQLLNRKLPALRLDAIFISHLHGDHYFGLIGLISSMNLRKRHKALHLLGPPGLDEIITLQLKHAKTRLDFPLHFHVIEYERKIIYENKVLTVETIPLHHRVPCCGFLFREKTKPRAINKDFFREGMIPYIPKLKEGLDIKDESGKIIYKNEDFTFPPKPSRSYAFCSDTLYQPHLADQLRGVDILYHEATFMHADEKSATQTQHSTTTQAAQLAREAEVKMLVIGHYSARYKILDEWLKEARNIFPSTYMAEEGAVFSPVK